MRSIDVPGEEDAGDGDDAGEQDQGEADAVGGEVVVDAEGGDPGHVGDGDASRRCGGGAKAVSAMAKPAMAVSSARMRAAAALRFGQQEQRGGAEKRDVDGPSEHIQDTRFNRSASAARAGWTVLLMTPRMSCG